MNLDNTTQLIQGIISILVVVVIPWLGYQTSRWLSQAQGHIHNQRTRDAVSGLVAAAEQTLTNPGAKYNYVYSTTAKWFPELTHGEVDSLIHASVLALHTTLGTSHSLEANRPDEGDDTGAAMPSVDVGALIADLSKLVAPSLTADVSNIVQSHVLITPPPPPAPLPPAPPIVPPAGERVTS